MRALGMVQGEEGTQKVEKVEKSLSKPITTWAEDRGLATITTLIEVKVVNLAMN